MWNIPTPERLAAIPRFNETKGAPTDDLFIHLHFFIGGSDWYIAEYDGVDTFFGYTILNGDLQNAEWGYISFTELKAVKVNGFEIDCELEEFWEVKSFSEVNPHVSHLLEKRKLCEKE